MPNGTTIFLWLLLPALAPVVAWLVLARRSRANPNADIAQGVDDLRRFRNTLSDTNPDGESE